MQIGINNCLEKGDFYCKLFVFKHVDKSDISFVWLQGEFSFQDLILQLCTQGFLMFCIFPNLAFRPLKLARKFIVKKEAITKSPNENHEKQRL